MTPNSPSISSIQNLIVTGAKFLVLRPQASTNFDLPGLKLGVLPNTTTEAFVRETYPRADIVTFSGAEDRQQAVQAVISGQIDAFIGDSLLSEAELAQQNLPRDQFALVPEVPLTCEYYGLILPHDAPEWKATVDQFLIESEEIKASLDQDLSQLDYCLNR